VQLTVTEVSKLLGVSEGTVRRWIRDRGLPAIEFNEQYRLNRIDLLVWAQANRVPVPGHAFTHDVPGEVSLSSALLRGGIHRNVPGSDRAQVLQAAVERVPLPAEVDRRLLLDMIVAREALGATGIGHGIAIPHARYPIVVPTEPMLGLCFLATPVDFGALDGVPVIALFVLAAPTVRTHLGILSRLAAALSADLLRLLQDRADDAAIKTAALAADAAMDRRSPRTPQP